ncbi:hypothetical protein [Hansschlegelia zhihuaiae]|uniref:DUF680 domain-containing protein n=1 Tax=Hansschlegelia zhihuaiae TaxID=405005 RepID=A0A4Q0MI53_9HYPH|nr:hypothetical protein [Hansschlegelia zhihuaiae]RXF72676.1 hypothetical protein EK403_14010 [Hansschlegelia zhihuaiae]
MKTVLFALAASALVATTAMAEPANHGAQRQSQAPVASSATLGKGDVVRMRQVRDVAAPAERNSSLSSFDWTGDVNNG